MKLIFYGGVEEVGGNKILLKDKETKIFLDFGLSFSEKRKFYSEPWISPKDERGLLELGILPYLKGVYEFDKTQPLLDCIFLSHSHADHSLYVSFLNRKIPVYCGETTALILKALSETRTKSFETNISGLTFNTFRSGDKIRIGSLEIEPIHVDHSVAGAYGFIINTPNGALVYTGDFRIHGTKPSLTLDFIKKAKEVSPVYMISEGTNILEAEVSSENEVKTKISKVVSSTSGLVLADFSYTDTDRFKTFYEVAKENDKFLAIPLRQAYLLEKLKEDKKLEIPNLKEDENIIIYRKTKKSYLPWEKEIIKNFNVFDISEIRNIQNRIIMVCSFFDINELIYIKPKPGSNFILSSSEPFNEEREIEYEKFINWLNHFGLPMYHIHCSGHIMPNDLKNFINE
ncbi:MAG: MBL fold metallo-hydrolase, partial [Candidatus Bathyarchaeia archaeon]